MTRVVSLGAAQERREMAAQLFEFGIANAFVEYGLKNGQLLGSNQLLIVQIVHRGTRLIDGSADRVQ